ncbi:MAG: hypothetical protein ACYDH1_10345 [Anaerolineaceae bacterium]
MVKRSEINHIEDLIQWLNRFNISQLNWGLNQTKTVNNLFDEIQKGECWLVENIPVRVVSVVQLLIYQNGFLLIEKEQLLCDDRVRIRLIPPSEKMKENEDWKSAAYRCLEEELQISADKATILPLDVKAKIRNKISFSYPGLRSKYYLYQVQALVQSLPTDEFWTTEKTEIGITKVINKHKWGWVKPESIHLNSGRSLRESD